MNNHDVGIASVGIVSCIFALVVLACGLTTQQGVQDIITLDNVVCSAAAQQPNEPAFEQFICSVLDPSGHVTQTFIAKVPAAQAASFAKAHLSTAPK